MKENSIKNERTSIKEDIKDLKKYISFSKKHENFSHDVDWKWHKEIGEKIERVLKENEELKFEERSRIIGKYGDAEIHDVINRTLSNDYIPVQKIKDIIDRINYDIKKTKEIILNGRKNDYQIVRLRAMNTKSLDIKKRLQELLESEE